MVFPLTTEEPNFAGAVFEPTSKSPPLEDWSRATFEVQPKPAEPDLTPLGISGQLGLSPDDPAVNARIFELKRQKSIQEVFEGKKLRQYEFSSLRQKGDFKDANPFTLLENVQSLPRFGKERQAVYAELQRQGIPLEAIKDFDPTELSGLEKMGSEALSAIGATAATLIPGGLAAKAAYAAGGGMIGAIGNQAIKAKYFPEEGTKLGQEILYRGLEEGITQAAVGPVIGLGGRILRPASTELVNPDAIRLSSELEAAGKKIPPKGAGLLETMTLSRIEPTNLTPSQMLTSTFHDTMQNIINNSLTAPGKAKSKEVSKLAAGKVWVKDVLDQIGEDTFRNLSDPEFSALLSGELQGAISVNRMAARQIYQSIDATFADQVPTVNVGSIIDKAKQTIAQIKGGRLAQRYPGQLKELQELANMKQMQNFTDVKVSWLQSAYDKAEAAKAAGDGGRAKFWSEMAGDYKKAIQDAAVNFDAANPGANLVQKLSEADQLWGEAGDETEDYVLSRLLGKIDEKNSWWFTGSIADGEYGTAQVNKVKDLLLRTTRKTTEQIAKDRKTWKTIQYNAFANILDKSKSGPEQVISAQLLADRLRSLESKKILEVLFDPEQISRLEDAKKLFTYIEKTPKGSGTIWFQMMQAGAIGGIAAEFSDISGGGWTSNATAAGAGVGLGFLFGPRIMAKVLLSPGFSRYASKGLMTKTGVDATKFGANLAARYIREAYQARKEMMDEEEKAAQEEKTRAAYERMSEFLDQHPGSRGF